jgi:Domain of unknown function (DUF4157)/Family of unknown function (DUF5995)
MSEPGSLDRGLDPSPTGDDAAPEAPPMKIGHFTQIQRLVQRIGTGAAGAPAPIDTGAALRMIADGPPGAALADDVRGPVERITGGDLGAARVHTGPEAAGAAGALSARAFTYGSDIYLGAGESAGDRALMAHEATHAVQQAGAAAPQAKSVGVSTPGDAGEVEADRVADAVIAGDLSPQAVTPIGASAARIARKPVNTTTTPAGPPAPVPADTIAPPAGEDHTDSEGHRIKEAGGHWYLDEAPKSPIFVAAPGAKHELIPINPNASFAALRARVVAAQAEQLAYSISLKGDMKYWFAKVYYYVTTNELAAIAAGKYQYPHMKLQEVLAFHATYKQNLDNWKAGAKGKVEAQWREAFSAAENSEHWYATRSIEIMNALLPSMQAHIRIDLPRAIASCYVTHYAGIPGTSMADFLVDFNEMGPVFDKAQSDLLPEVKAETGVLDVGRYGAMQDLGFPFIFNVPMERQHTWEKAGEAAKSMQAGESSATYEKRMRAMTGAAHPFSGDDDFSVNGTDVGSSVDWMHQPGAKPDPAAPGPSYEAAPAPPTFPERLYFKLDHPHDGEKLEHAIRDDQDLAPYKALAEWTRKVRGAQLYMESHVSSEGEEAHNMDLTARRLSTMHNFLFLCGADLDNNTINEASVGPAGAAPTPDWRYVLVAIRANGTGRQQHNTPNPNLPGDAKK